MKTESVSEAGTFIYQDNLLVAVIKRDSSCGKNIVYTTKEATSEQIAALINPSEK